LIAEKAEKYHDELLAQLLEQHGPPNLKSALSTGSNGLDRSRDRPWNAGSAHPGPGHKRPGGNNRPGRPNHPGPAPVGNTVAADTVTPHGIRPPVETHRKPKREEKRKPGKKGRRPKKGRKEKGKGKRHLYMQEILSG